MFEPHKRVFAAKFWQEGTSAMFDAGFGAFSSASSASAYWPAQQCIFQYLLKPFLGTVHKLHNPNGHVSSALRNQKVSRSKAASLKSLHNLFYEVILTE